MDLCNIGEVGEVVATEKGFEVSKPSEVTEATAVCLLDLKAGVETDRADMRDGLMQLRDVGYKWCADRIHEHRAALDKLEKRVNVMDHDIHPAKPYTLGPNRQSRVFDDPPDRKARYWKRELAQRETIRTLMGRAEKAEEECAEARGLRNSMVDELIADLKRKYVRECYCPVCQRMRRFIEVWEAE